LLQKFLIFFRFSYPIFWRKKSNILYKLIILVLLPLSLLFFLISSIQKKIQKSNKIGVPVICIGNLVAGGSGKTPMVLHLLKLLKKRCLNIHVVSRGYGGNLKGPIKVEKEKHTFDQVGDEALLIAKENNIWISKNKYAGVFAATLNGADLIILDDGLQNNSIKKDLNIVVVDGEFGFGNGLILPAGPLREPYKQRLKKSDILILLNNDKYNIQKKINKYIPIIKGKSFIKNYKNLIKKKLVVFSGIGRPEKFLNSLKKKNLNILKFFSFPDHYAYSKNDLNKIINYSKNNNAIPVTTLKDKQRINRDLRKKIYFVDLEIKLEKTDVLSKKLKLKNCIK